jgi:DNA-binding NarL/FixJ family response regulator
MRRILLVEDHSAFRETLAFILNREPDLEVVGQAGSVAEAHALSESNGFDVAIIDLFLPDGNGTELVPRLWETHPDGSVIMLTISLDPSMHDAARGAGANEVLDKHDSLDNILDTVRHLAALTA